jgi:hypothetical protein
MTPTSDTDLRVLAEAATPGPWRHSGATVWAPLNQDDPTDYSGEAVAFIPTLGDEFDADDAAWIAAADPTTILALIDRLQRVETALRDLVEAGDAMFTAEVRYASVGGHCSGCGHSDHLPDVCDTEGDTPDPADHCGCSGDDNEAAVEDASDRLVAALSVARAALEGDKR